MYNSIQHFMEKGIKKLEEIFLQYVEHPENFAEMIQGVQKSVVELGLSMIEEELESYDSYLRDNKHARPDWYIVKQDRTTLMTSLGSINYSKTLFQHKKTKERCYLLDKFMGMAPHTRLTEDAEAKILQEVVESSYEKVGTTLCLSGEQISKETVMHKLHNLSFPTADIPEEKKIADYLYLDADEDHIRLQYRRQKGDLERNQYGRKNNNAIAKLIYVYEGIETETLHGKRKQLKSPHYFARVGNGRENDALWDEVSAYLDNHYEMEQAKKLYVNADGGEWIKSGIKRLGCQASYVLDGYHLTKYLTRLSSHMKERADEVKEELYRLIEHGTKEKFVEYASTLKCYLPNHTGEKRIDESIAYIISNWNAAKLRLKHKEGVLGSSTEGHVSHVLSSRMSSRPMGWSITGMSKMAELRAYHYNGGDMLKLVRYQKNIQEKTVSDKQKPCSGQIIIQEERRQARQLGIYAGMKTYSVSRQVRKQAAIRHSICGL